MAIELSGGAEAPEMNRRQQRRIPGLKQMRERMREPDARVAYRRRKELVELVFGVLKQQKAFDSFQREYNQDRPHEALNNATPQSCYQASPRCYPRRIAELDYGDEMEVRRVSQQGSVKWEGERAYISEVFGYEPLGLKKAAERWLEVYYGPVLLGWLDGKGHRFSRRKPKALQKVESES